MDTTSFGGNLPQQLQPNYIQNQANYLHQAGIGHHMHHILNIHNHRSLTNSPISNPGSPGLDMIQEELPPIQCTSKFEQQQICHPQISVTDVLGKYFHKSFKHLKYKCISGSEVTLVAGSDTSEDSMDSLENQKISKIPSFIISEPSENQPSITRGIGRKSSTENDDSKFFTKQPEPEHQEELFLRRNSDKSSVYSDDSLSNDSLSIGNRSPSSSSNTQSSHAFDSEIRNRQMENYEKINQELSNAGTGNFQIFQNLNLGVVTNQGNTRFFVQDGDRSDIQPENLSVRDSGFDNLHKNSGSFEFELSDMCSKLETIDILEMVKKTINDQVPPKVCVLKSVSEDLSDKLSLEYEGGIQIELKIIDRERETKGLKVRRISGDYMVYNQLCQQLISCMTVS